MALTATFDIDGLTTADASASPPVPAAPAPVLRVTGGEELGGLYDYTVDILLTGDVAAADALGQEALLKVTDGTQTRIIHGLVTEWTPLGTQKVANQALGHVHRAHLGPAAARMRDGRASAITASANPVAVVKALLAAWSIPFSSDFVTESDHATRQQVVRYDETAWDFLVRILAEEGLHCYFVHSFGANQDLSTSLGSHVLVISGASANAVGTESDPGAAYVNPQDTNVATAIGSWNALSRFRRVDRDGPLRLDVDDHDYRSWSANPMAGQVATPLTAIGWRADPTTPGERVVTAFPGGAAGQVDGGTFPTASGADPLSTQLAERDADRELARRHSWQGSGDHIGLSTGTVFAFTGQSQQYLVTRSRLVLEPNVQLSPPGWSDATIGATLMALVADRVADWHRSDRFAHYDVPTAVGGVAVTWGQGRALSARSEIEAFPVIATHPWRPPRPPRPAIPGIHHATVQAATASDQSAVHTDSLARVKVRFPWASADDTMWIRVAQPAVGSDGSGVLCAPRVGDEIAVMFEYGDPDRPLAVGNLFRHDRRPPVDPTAEPGRLSLRSRYLAGHQHRPSGATNRAVVETMAVGDSGLTWMASENDDEATNASTLAFSEIAFDDKDGQQRLDIFAAGDKREQVAGSSKIHVGGTLTIEAGTKIELKVGDSVLSLTPTTAKVGYVNPTLPAIGSTFTANARNIKIVAPTLDMTGWMRAKMASSAASFKAELVYAKMHGFSSDMSSDFLSAVVNLLCSWMGIFLSSGQGDDTRSTSKKEALETYAWVKESLTAGCNIAKFITKAVAIGKKNPADLVGEAWCEAVAGTAALKTRPISGNSFRTALRAIKAFNTFLAATSQGGKNDDAANTSMAASTFSMGAGVVQTAGDMYDYLNSWYTTNKISFGCVSGVSVLGTKWEKVMLMDDENNLKDNDRTVARSEMSGRDDETVASESHNALQQSDQSVSDTDTSVQNSDQQVVATQNQVGDQSAEVGGSEVGVGEQQVAVAERQGAVIESHTPG